MPGRIEKLRSSVRVSGASLAVLKIAEAAIDALDDHERLIADLEYRLSRISGGGGTRQIHIAEVVYDTIPVTTTTDVTLVTADLNRIWIFKNTTGAFFVKLPVMVVPQWVVVKNDSGSTNDLDLQDSAGNTIATIAKGTSSGRVSVDISAVPAPE